MKSVNVANIYKVLHILSKKSFINPRFRNFSKAKMNIELQRFENCVNLFLVVFSRITKVLLLPNMFGLKKGRHYGTFSVNLSRFMTRVGSFL